MSFITIGAGLLVLLTIGSGIYFLYNEADGKSKLKTFYRANLAIFIPVMAGALILLAPDVVSAATDGAVATDSGMKFLGAALSTGLACIGAGYAVGVVGSAALGAVSEDPKILGKTLIFVGLAEGIAIYGLIISIMVLGS
jgi:V/A-type H+-transporting ATPase subunit K